MKTALLRLFSSMKFWTLLLGLGTSLGAKYGLNVDPETYWSMVGLFGLLLGVQGLNDHGKAKAEIETRSIQSGSARLDLLAWLVLPAIAGVLFATACTALKSEAKHATSDVVDCMKPQLADRSHELGSVLETSVLSLITDQGHVDKAGFKALTRELKSDAAGCAIAAVVSRLSKPRDQGAPFASPLTVDAGELQAAWAETQRQQFGGRTFVLEAGS
jgi:hypothetical protein